jgi:hypothetical protein
VSPLGTAGITLSIRIAVGHVLVSQVSVDVTQLDAMGVDVHQAERVSFSGLLPFARQEWSCSWGSRKGVKRVKTLRLEWATDWQRGLQKKEIPFPEIK